MESLQVQLDQAKKAGEDTAAKLKEVMFNQPAQSTKQVSDVHVHMMCLCSWNDGMYNIDSTLTHFFSFRS